MYGTVHPYSNPDCTLSRQLLTVVISDQIHENQVPVYKIRAESQHGLTPNEVWEIVQIPQKSGGYIP